jgi:hypothetical protein
MSNPNPAFVSVITPGTASGIFNIDYNSLVAVASTIHSTMVLAPQTTVQTGALVYPANYGSYYQITNPYITLSPTKIGTPVDMPFASASTLNVVGPNITGSGEPGSGKTGA